MTREDKLVERITKITKIALGEEPNKDFSEAIIKAMLKAAKMGYNFAVDEAAEWLERTLPLRPDDRDEFIEQFKEAMKGE